MCLYSRRESEEYRGPEREFEPSPNGPFETKWGCTVEVEGDDRDSTIFIAGGEQEPVRREEKKCLWGFAFIFRVRQTQEISSEFRETSFHFFKKKNFNILTGKHQIIYSLKIYSLKTSYVCYVFTVFQTTVFFIDPDSGYFERYPEMPSGYRFKLILSHKFVLKIVLFFFLFQS